MKSAKWMIILLTITGLAAMPCFAQLEDAIEQLTGNNTKGYLQPFVDAFGANLNTGINHSASVPLLGLNLYVGVVAMGTFIPDDDLTFMATPPQPYPQEKVETATVFGDKGAVVTHSSGLSYAFQNGQIQGNFAPVAVPHLEIGSFLGTKLKFRYFAYDLGESVGDMKLLGYGLQHSINRYFPLLPVSISASLFLQSFDVGDILSAKTTSIGVQASKSFTMLTLYGGVSMDNTSMDVDYTYEGEDMSEDISLSLKSSGNIRMTVGASLRLGILNLNGDYNIGSQNTATLGVGFQM